MKRLSILATAVTVGLAGLVAPMPGRANAQSGSVCGPGCITEYAMPPTVSDGPFGLATGPDHALWFTHGDAIGRLTLAGRETEYPLPTSDALAGWITEGPDGAMWFTERAGNKIGRITTTGQVTEYPIPTTVPDENGNPGSSNPQGIVVGQDGALWFTERDADKIGRLTLDGHISEFPLPTRGVGPQGLAVGRDGSLWFTERSASQIGRMAPNGHFTEYPLAPGASPQRIVAGQDGAIWFTELKRNVVGKITANGVITEYPVGNGPVGITAGPDGALWIVEFGANAIGRLSYGGKLVAEYPIPTTNDAYALQVAVGPDGNPWFGEVDANKVGQLHILPPQPILGRQSMSFTVTFNSAVPGQGNVYFGSGPGCLGLVEVATRDLSAGSTQHRVLVTGNDLPGSVGDNGIQPGATYWFETVTVTRRGNEVDNHNGACYSATMPGA